MNRYWLPGWLAILSLALAAWPVLGWAADAPSPAAKEPVKPAEPADGPTLAEAQKARVEKKLKEITDELAAIQAEEGKVATAVNEAKSKALTMVQEQDKLQENLEKGSTVKGVKEYRQAHLMGAAQGKTFDARYGRLQASIKGLERQTRTLPDDLKKQIEDTAAQIAERRRANREKTAGYYEAVYAYKEALAVYMSIWKEIPEKNREAEKTLKDKITELEKKVNPPRNERNGSNGGSGDRSRGGTGGGWGR